MRQLDVIGGLFLVADESRSLCRVGAVIHEWCSEHTHTHTDRQTHIQSEMEILTQTQAWELINKARFAPATFRWLETGHYFISSTVASRL